MLLHNLSDMVVHCMYQLSTVICDLKYHKNPLAIKVSWPHYVLCWTFGDIGYRTQRHTGIWWWQIEQLIKCQLTPWWVLMLFHFSILLVYWYLFVDLWIVHFFLVLCHKKTIVQILNFCQRLSYEIQRWSTVTFWKIWLAEKI